MFSSFSPGSHQLETPVVGMVLIIGTASMILEFPFLKYTINYKRAEADPLTRTK